MRAFIGVWGIIKKSNLRLGSTNVTPTSDAYEVREDVEFGAMEGEAANAKSEDGPEDALPSGLANTNISGALW